MTTLNCLPRAWDSFIQGNCARNNLVKFSRLWEECSQENMGNEDQSLIVHTKKTRRDHHHSKGKHSHSRRDMSIIRCYTCDEKGHISKYYPKNKGKSHKKRGNKRRHHAHDAKDDEPSTKRIRQESDDSSSDEEYLLISAR